MQNLSTFIEAGDLFWNQQEVGYKQIVIFLSILFWVLTQRFNAFLTVADFFPDMNIGLLMLHIWAHQTRQARTNTQSYYMAFIFAYFAMYWSNVYVGFEHKVPWPTFKEMDHDGRVTYGAIALVWLTFVESLILNEMRSDVVGPFERC